MPHTRSSDQTIEAFSLSKDLLNAAKLRAAKHNMSKSGYFRYCLAKELGYPEEDAVAIAAHGSVQRLIQNMANQETVLNDSAAELTGAGASAKKGQTRYRISKDIQNNDPNSKAVSSDKSLLKKASASLWKMPGAK